MTLNFYRDGELYAMRFWSVVPRVGDTVVLAKTEFEVQRVRWTEDSRTEKQVVDIVVRKRAKS